jgi:hypothetical protein
MPLDLNDDELKAIMVLAGPLSPRSRDSYLRAIAAELAALPADRRGPGTAHRVALGLQRQFLGPAPRVA